MPALLVHALLLDVSGAAGRASDGMASRFLALYLADHHAGSTAGLELARRAVRDHRGTERGEALGQIATAIAEDRIALERLLGSLGMQPSRLKDGLAWTAEKLGRLKPNGSLRGPTPLGRLNDIEALQLGVVGKRALWESLRQLPEVVALPEIDLPELMARADRQLVDLERMHREAATEALQG